jgi:uncharacterized protein YfdQ (DUF2303 family)
METKTDIGEVIKTAGDAVPIEPRIGHVETIPFVILRPGEKVAVLEEALAALECRADSPIRRSGVSTHTELASFIEHANRFKEKESVVWADIGRVQLVVVFNADPAGSNAKKAGWGDHRSQYTCPRSPEWLAWTRTAGISMSSEKFAAFIDKHMDNLTDGEGAASPIALMETARNLQIFTKGTFLKRVNPETGEYHMVAKEEHDKENSTKIPRKFCLALRVFEGGELYRVEARIQFAINDGCPSFSFDLHRADEILRDAFSDVRDEVKKETELPVFAGTP